MTHKKEQHLKKVSNNDNVIAALAIDQRGAIQSMITGFDDEKRDNIIIKFKEAVSKHLTPYSSSILLDPIYGLDAIKSKDNNCGLLLAYEVTGYEKGVEGRLPRLLDDESVIRLIEKGADAIKLLVYYDVDQSDDINNKKKAFVERVAAECRYYDIPLFLEILTYDEKISDTKSKEFAKVKPHKVNGAVEAFLDERFGVDVFKVEVPVNMKYVEGYSDEVVFTKEEAKKYFKEQSDLMVNVPFIFLSAGVTNQMFNDTLYLAKESGSKFNGVLCGRATWADGVAEFVKSEEQGIKWLQTVGKENIESLNKALKETATPWK